MRVFDPSIIIAHNQNPTYNTAIEIHDIDQIYSFTSFQAHKISAKKFNMEISI